MPSSRNILLHDGLTEKGVVRGIHDVTVPRLVSRGCVVDIIKVGKHLLTDIHLQCSLFSEGWSEIARCNQMDYCFEVP